MFGTILGFIGDIISPVRDIIDEVHTSEEEKLKIKAEMFKMEMAMSSKFMDYERQLLESKTKIITAEAQGQSVLQRTWRPITMLTFLVLVVCDSFGWLANPLADQAWTLLQIGLGGYVTGRSLEKIAPSIGAIIQKK